MGVFEQREAIGRTSNIDGSVRQLGSPKSKEFFGNADNLNKISQVAGIAGQLGSAALDNSNTQQNLKYGRSDSDAMRSSASGVVSAINPVAGAIYGAANAVGSTIGSAWNKSNNYDEFGYNHASKAQGSAYLSQGYVFDPVGGMMRTAKQGGAGTGARMLLNLINPLGAGVAQYKHEQAAAEDLMQTKMLMDKSGYELNRFQHNPNFDV